MGRPAYVFIFLCVCSAYKVMTGKVRAMDDEEIRKHARAFIRNNKVVFDRLAKL